MQRRSAATMLGALLCSAGAHAGDTVSVDGEVDVRWVHATGPESWLAGGSGTFRFDAQHDGLRFARAFLEPRVRVSDTVTVQAVIDTYGDHDRNPLDVSELFADYRPFPTGAVRGRLRLGAFHLPASLENRGHGWEDVYTLTPSAINTWFGEEFRTVGAEVELRWLGSSIGYPGDVALVGAVYGWNDPAGALIADRGFALSDRPSTLFGGLGRPPITFYHEIDGRPGYYAGLAWRRHDRFELRALRYDNRADPTASSISGGAAWLTRFSSLGLRLEPTAEWTLVAQYLDGDTVVGPFAPGAESFRMTYKASFALGSYEWRRERWTLRYDDFRTHNTSGIFGPPADNAGHAWTVGWMHEFGEHWQLATEWIRMSSVFPPRVLYGDPAAARDSQLQVAIRFRFSAAR